MLTNRIAGKNYFVVLIILLAITVIMVSAAFLITALVPDSLGRSPYDYSVGRAYDFEPWVFEINSLSCSYPAGGSVVFLNETEQKRSILLIGNEAAVCENLDKSLKISSGGLFMLIEDSVFEQARGSNIFREITDSRRLSEIEAIAGQQVGVPVLWKDTVPLTFHPGEGLAYYYFISEEGKPVMPPAVGDSIRPVVSSFIVYFLFVLIMLLSMSILTLDHHYSGYWVDCCKYKPGRFAAMLSFPTAALAIFFKIAPLQIGFSSYYSTAGYAAIIIVLLLLAQKGLIPRLDFGFNRSRLRHGYLLALFASLVIVFTIRGMPSGINLSGPQALAGLPLAFFLVALPREMIWRGFVQTMIGRQWGWTAGIAAVVLLAMASRLTFVAFAEPWMLFYPYTYLESIILAPGMAAVLGYLYLRSENILACAVLHSLVIFLPGVLIY